MKAAIYARISTKGRGQDTQNQLRTLKTYCRQQGWTITKLYVDEVSGSTSNREQFQALFSDAHQRKFDLVLFWALDRFSREGALETLKRLEKLTAFGVAWKSYTEQYLDSAGLFKDAIVSIMATLAKQERVKISERTLAGLATARAKGKRLGRPKKVFDREKLNRMRRKGASLGTLAKEFGISRTHAARLTKSSTV
jgi:DNA invertase Pin-like site-specific DNA recombinase